MMNECEPTTTSEQPLYVELKGNVVCIAPPPEGEQDGQPSRMLANDDSDEAIHAALLERAAGSIEQGGKRCKLSDAAILVIDGVPEPSDPKEWPDAVDYQVVSVTHFQALLPSVKGLAEKLLASPPPGTIRVVTSAGSTYRVTHVAVPQDG